MQSRKPRVSAKVSEELPISISRPRTCGANEAARTRIEISRDQDSAFRLSSHNTYCKASKALNGREST